MRSLGARAARRFYCVMLLTSALAPSAGKALADESILNGVRVQPESGMRPMADAGLPSSRAALGPGTLIDFDDRSAACLFVDTLRLTTRYAGLGVTFSGPGGNDGGAIVHECGNFGVVGNSSPNFLGFNEDAVLFDGGRAWGPETLVFSFPVSTVSLEAGHTLGGTLTMEAYNADDVLVDSESVILDRILVVVSVSAPAITRVVLDATGSIFVVDDLVFVAAVTGACCNRTPGAGGDCSITVAEDCPVSAQQSWSESATCAEVACAEATGACCDRLLGNCRESLQALCNCEQCTWTKNAACSQVTCVAAGGACCDGLRGDCRTSSQALCDCEQCTWTKNAACSQVTCVAAEGACCDHGPFGTCTDGVTLASCDCSTCAWVKLGACAEMDCPHDTIPTVSTWGLVVLSLMLMAGAKIRFGRARCHCNPSS